MSRLAFATFAVFELCQPIRDLPFVMHARVTIATELKIDFIVCQNQNANEKLPVLLQGTR